MNYVFKLLILNNNKYLLYFGIYTLNMIENYVSILDL